MQETKLIGLICQRCGGALAANGNVYTCTCCGKSFEKQTAIDLSDQLRTALGEQTKEKIANLKQLLWKETHEEFVSNKEVERLSKDVLKLNPDDFYANFYLATCSPRRGELAAFLSAIDISNRYDDVPVILDYLIRGLKDDWSLCVGDLIERAYKSNDIRLFNKYRTQFEAENNKLDECVYEPSIPRDVFVAYSSADMPQVERLVSALEAEELTCFVAARNLRHGSGSVENYETAIRTAIDRCSVLVFVSSQNSRSVKCDAYKELNYIEKSRPSMPRIEYIIKDYAGRAAERYFKTFFSGLEYCTSESDVLTRVFVKIMGGSEDTKPVATAQPAPQPKSKPQLEPTHKAESKLEPKVVPVLHKTVDNAVQLFQKGKDYYYGYGVEQNYVKAVEYYRIAAEQGGVTAQFHLGWCYYNGEGTEQNYEEAVKWFHKAAEQGNVNAQFLLGVCYYYGDGVKQDKEEAVKWYRKAAEQGSEDAIEKLRDLGEWDKNDK